MKITRMKRGENFEMSPNCGAWGYTKHRWKRGRCVRCNQRKKDVDKLRKEQRKK